MIRILNLIGRFALRIKNAFTTNIESFVGSFIVTSLLFFVICHFIPKEDLPWFISEYIFETFLFMIVYPAMILVLWCPNRKEKQKAFSVIFNFFLHILIALLLIVIPPLFFNYLILWIEGLFRLFKSIKFWLFVLFEIIVYGLMLYFNLGLNIILLWCLACEVYLLIWIHNTEYQKKKGKQ